MTKRILLIDDIRSDCDINGLDIPRFIDGPEPIESVLIARTYTLGVDALRLMGPWDILYLDHDLAAPGLTQPEKTGYDIILWLEEQLHNKNYHLIPGEMICVSANPPGRDRINQGWSAIQSKRKL